MKKGNDVQAMPGHAEVERAIRSVPGVAEATVTRASDTGRGRLRIRLHPGEDPDRVSWSVAATLRERFDIALDPAEIRPRLSPTPQQSAPDGEPRVIDVDEDGASGEIRLEEPDRSPQDVPLPDDEQRPGSDEASPSGSREAPVNGHVETHYTAPWRPAIRDLASRNDGSRVTVTATLALTGRAATGEARGVPTARGLRRAIAEATVGALSELTDVPLRAQVERVTLGEDDPSTVTVVVMLLTTRGEELLLGGSIVRGDVEHAVMRATLDALNRRVQRELAGDGH